MFKRNDKDVAFIEGKVEGLEFRGAENPSLLTLSYPNDIKVGAGSVIVFDREAFVELARLLFGAAYRNEVCEGLREDLECHMRALGFERCAYCEGSSCIEEQWHRESELENLGSGPACPDCLDAMTTEII